MVSGVSQGSTKDGQAGKLKVLKARKLPGFLASHSSSYELSAISYELFA